MCEMMRLNLFYIDIVGHSSLFVCFLASFLARLFPCSFHWGRSVADICPFSHFHDGVGGVVLSRKRHGREDLNGVRGLRVLRKVEQDKA